MNFNIESFTEKVQLIAAAPNNKATQKQTAKAGQKEYEVSFLPQTIAKHHSFSLDSKDEILPKIIELKTQNYPLTKANSRKIKDPKHEDVSMV